MSRAHGHRALAIRKKAGARDAAHRRARRLLAHRPADCVGHVRDRFSPRHLLPLLFHRAPTPPAGASSTIRWSGAPGSCAISACPPPDPNVIGEEWRQIWLSRLEHLRPPVHRWLRHQRRDTFWRHGSVCEDPSAIEAAVYAVGGWADGYSNAVFRMMENLERLAVAKLDSASDPEPPAGGIVGGGLPLLAEFPHEVPVRVDLNQPVPALPDRHHRRHRAEGQCGIERIARRAARYSHAEASTALGAGRARRGGQNQAPERRRRTQRGTLREEDAPRGGADSGSSRGRRPVTNQRSAL